MRIKLFLLLFILPFYFSNSVNAGYKENCLDYQNNKELDYSAYNICAEEYSKEFERGYDAYERGEYGDSIDYFEIAGKYAPNDVSTKHNIVLALVQLGDINFDKGDYKKAINYYYSVTVNSYKYENLYQIYIQLASSHYYRGDKNSTTNVHKYLEKAMVEAVSQDEIDYIKSMKYYFNSLSKVTTNDTLAWTQYYLHSMNIPAAWNKITNDIEVVVAVIDDGVYINHPDLKEKIWTNPNSKYGESSVIDFTNDGYDNLAAGKHGTLISGIIAAEQNNKEGISGIAKNVKIMALRVFDIDENSSVESVISAIDYAIENGANIINLSLGQTQFKYSNEFDEIIKKAYLNNVIVVIAAGNGDTYSFKEIGVDLTQNPIAPICNNGGEGNFSIGVYASGKNGYRTNWSNYGNCAKFMAPGEDIVSTSIPIFNKSYGNYYSEESGTSFSAPIISGIIALGFNQYGEVPPDIVYNSLINSLTVNDVGNYLVDAKKYLEELENFISEEAEKNEFNELKSSYKADFKKTVGDKLLKIPKSSIKKILKQLDAMLKVQLTEDLKAKVEALKELLEDSL